MTTVIAVESKDDVIVCADSQQTSWVKEYANKIINVGPHALLGCAGRSEYIGIFEKYMIDGLIRKNQPKELWHPTLLLNSILDSYSKYVVQRMEDLKLAKYDRDYDPKSYFPEAIYAYFDDESGIFRIYTTEPLNPWMELPQFSRAAIGSGGIAGTVFLKTAEDYMEHFGLGWKNFSTKAVSHFLWIVMRRISNIDPFSSGIKIYRLGTEKTTELRFDEADDSLSSLTKDIVADLSPVKTKEILDKIDLANILKGLGLG